MTRADHVAATHVTDHVRDERYGTRRCDKVAATHVTDHAMGGSSCLDGMTQTRMTRCDSEVDVAPLRVTDHLMA